jgi:hypothetical protein
MPQKKAIEIVPGEPPSLRVHYTEGSVSEALNRGALLFGSSGERLQDAQVAARVGGYPSSAEDDNSVLAAAVSNAATRVGFPAPTFDSPGATVDALAYLAELVQSYPARSRRSTARPAPSPHGNDPAYTGVPHEPPPPPSFRCRLCGMVGLTCDGCPD